MTKLELAREYMYSLYNDADHLSKLVDEARHALSSGDTAGALRWLAEAERPAGMISMRLSDAKRAVGVADSVPPATPEVP